jgi:hypothetical protein
LRRPCRATVGPADFSCARAWARVGISFIHSLSSDIARAAPEKAHTIHKSDTAGWK